MAIVTEQEQTWRQQLTARLLPMMRVASAERELAMRATTVSEHRSLTLNPAMPHTLHFCGVSSSVMRYTKNKCAKFFTFHRAKAMAHAKMQRHGRVTSTTHAWQATRNKSRDVRHHVGMHILEGVLVGIGPREKSKNNFFWGEPASHWKQTARQAADKSEYPQLGTSLEPP